MDGAPSSPLDVAPTLGPLSTGTLVGEYRLIEKVAEGGMGTIYSAVHPLIGKRAAVKVLHAALCADEVASQRFVQEARAANEIGHPGLVDVFSFGRLYDGRSYLVMEWLDGETLDARLATPLKLDEACAILAQICEALQAVHAHGIVHRDLKPQNVFLLRGDGPARVKLLDFGVAKVMSGSLHPTRSGYVVGTPDYVSPEQALGQEVDARSDLYSLGVVAFELLLGRRPFLGGGEIVLARQHIEQAPPLPSSLWPEIPLELEHLLLGLLDKDPARRPSLVEVRRHLLPYRASTIVLPPPVEESRISTGDGRTFAARSTRRLRGGGRLAAMLLLGALAGAAAGVALPRPPPTVIRLPAPPPPPPPASGALTLRVVPVSARIEIDGRAIASADGVGRAQLLPDATHELKVSAPGHQPLRQALVVTPGSALELLVSLKREPTGPRPLLAPGKLLLRAPELVP